MAQLGGFQSYGYWRGYDMVRLLLFTLLLVTSVKSTFNSLALLSFTNNFLHTSLRVQN
ncbi:hypothetical protein DL95DRAFT_384519 [Leptodontidium sp. 2 PMI_412]|nr:hypothetical protein DL95DRAFT_384519 [Leptodontidium sp. 2 PMI_412]